MADSSYLFWYTCLIGAILVGFVNGKTCWDSTWYNSSSPNDHGGSESESQPTEVLKTICPDGRAVIDSRCRDEKGEPFSGHKNDFSSKYIANCTVATGLICHPYSDGQCADFAIQYGCACPTTVPPQTTPPGTTDAWKGTTIDKGTTKDEGSTTGGNKHDANAFGVEKNEQEMEIQRLVKMYKAALRRKEKMNREVERRKKANELAARQRLEKDEKEERLRWDKYYEMRRIEKNDQAARQRRLEKEKAERKRLKMKADNERRQRLLYEEERQRRTSTPTSNLRRQLRPTTSFSTARVLFEDERQRHRDFLYSIFGSNFEESLLDSEEILSLLLLSDSVLGTGVLYEEEQGSPTPASNLGPTTSCSTSEVYEEERQRHGTNETLKNEESRRNSIVIHDDAAAADPDQCSICYDRKKDCFCAPCGHELCRTCLYSLEQCVCPFCRAEIESTGRLQAPIKTK